MMDEANTAKFIDFVTPVTHYGLPHHYVLKQADKTHNVLGLSVEELCRLYWRLKGVAVEYSYTVDGKTFTRSYVAKADGQPVDRVIKGWGIFHEDEDADCQFSCEVALGSVAKCPEKPGHYAVGLGVIDNDFDGSYCLSLFRNERMRLLDSKEFAFFGRTLCVYLEADPFWEEDCDKELSGSIGGMKIVPRFCEWESESDDKS